MNRTQLIDAVAQRSGITGQEAKAAVEALVEVITDAVTRGDKVVVPGLCTFETVDRAARSGRNPQTGEAMVIAARRAVKITATPALKAVVAGS